MLTPVCVLGGREIKEQRKCFKVDIAGSLHDRLLMIWISRNLRKGKLRKGTPYSTAFVQKAWKSG